MPLKQNLYVKLHLIKCILALIVSFTLLIIFFFFPPESSISTVAVCAGSGASVLTGVKADLYITGRSSEVHVHHIINTIPSTASVSASRNLTVSLFLII